VVGIYAVTAYAISQRTQEIGVRMALGANSRNVMWLVLRLGLMQLAVGLPLRIVGAFLTSHLLMQMLFQGTAPDSLAFAGIPALLTVTVVGASLLPAIRAARLNPVDALRVE